MEIRKVMANFFGERVAVVGDVMLDSYIYGNVLRISPEAPVPVVTVGEEVFGLGGAGNVAANIASLGGQAFLFGYVADDLEGKILSDRLKKRGISFELLPVLNQTILKTRIIGNRQQIVRVDREDRDVDIPKEVVDEVAEKLFAINPDIIIASDYAKGVLSRDLFLRIKDYAGKKGLKVIVDPKPQNKNNYSGVYLVTPNLEEAREMSGSNNVEEMGRRLQSKFLGNILLTRGKDGMTLFEQERVINIPTQAREVYDITGAGDTVVAVIALGLGSGLNLEKSVILANHAAGIVVRKAGTVSVSESELLQKIELGYNKIKSFQELKEIREDYKRKGRRVVWTNGCFDLIHAGHVSYLKRARELGDCLIVGINSDDFVRKLKGDGRPIIDETERAEILSSLECVDYVIVFPETDAVNCLREVKPEVYVKGRDYTLESMNQNERGVIEGYGGKICFIPLVEGISTTGIVKKIRGGNSG